VSAPVVPRLKMLVGADLSVTKGFETSASVGMSATLRGTVSQDDFAFSKTGPTFTKSATSTLGGKVSGSIYAKAKIAGDMYGVGGPYAVVKLGKEITADEAATPWVTSSAFVQAGLGVELEKCLKVMLANWCLHLSAGKDDLISVRKPLAAAIGGYPGPTDTPTAPTPTTPTHTPTPGQGTWSSLTAGGAHSCGVKTDGTAWCWGYNSSGRLGDGTTTDRASPTQVPGSWSSLTAGYWHSCGVKPDGTAWCWGDNGYGQLGDGTTTDRSTPTPVGGA
jgi:hypothetical protein